MVVVVCRQPTRSAAELIGRRRLAVPPAVAGWMCGRMPRAALRLPSGSRAAADRGPSCVGGMSAAIGGARVQGSAAESAAADHTDRAGMAGGEARLLAARALSRVGAAVAADDSSSGDLINGPARWWGCWCQEETSLLPARRGVQLRRGCSSVRSSPSAMLGCQSGSVGCAGGAAASALGRRVVVTLRLCQKPHISSSHKASSPIRFERRGGHAVVQREPAQASQAAVCQGRRRTGPGAWGRMATSSQQAAVCVSAPTRSPVGSCPPVCDGRCDLRCGWRCCWAGWVCETVVGMPRQSPGARRCFRHASAPRSRARVFLMTRNEFLQPARLGGAAHSTEGHAAHMVGDSTTSGARASAALMRQGP